MDKRKRGDGFPFAVVIVFVLLAASIIAFSPLGTAITTLLSKGGETAACSLSLYKGQGTARCPIHDAEITGGKLLIDKKVKKMRSISPYVPDKEAVAYLLKSCFERGGGKTSRAFSTENFFGVSRVCMQCYDLKVSEGISGTNEYLSSTKAPAEKEKTYLNLLSNDANHQQIYLLYGALFDAIPSTTSQGIRPSTSYSVIFIGHKKGTSDDLFTRLGSTIDLAMGNYAQAFNVAFSTHDQYFAYIIESSKVGAICERLVN
ncbi:MAG TPA: hypothetical protein VJB12_04170 [Candidatus Nanoarchaeia archaeon]|nr:hypothetical protein [Candidatus Nanoarchaeia archaeon]